MIFELREYRIKRGMRPAWVKLMDEVIIPFQKKMGMVIIASFIAQEEEDLYIWIRRFASKEERKRQYNKVYGNDYWTNEIRNAMGDMLVKSKTRVTLMMATPKSLIK